MINDHSYTFSDNLKYLALNLMENEPDKYRLYFSLKNKDGMDGSSIVPIKWLSFKHFYHAVTCSVLITNNGGTAYLPIRKNQLVINTWHGGGPYKVTGTQALNDYYNMGEQAEKISETRKKKNQRLIYWFEKDTQRNARKIDYILSSCRICTEVEYKGLFFTDEQCLDSGMPRIDYMFMEDKVREIKRRVFLKYEIPYDHKLILYAPTFRGFFTNYDGVISGDVLEIDHLRVLKAAKEKFGGNWSFAVRLHPKLKDAGIKDESLINMTQYPDGQEILMAADMLITDYSSVMWDMSFSNKPVFLFATDINDYQVKRGFYIPPEEWPFPLATTNDELDNNIRMFEHGAYEIRVKAHLDAVGSYEKGTACQTAREIIDTHFMNQARRS